MKEKATPLAEIARWVRAGILPYLSPTARVVMLVLGSHVNSEWEAWPSAETIAKACGFKRERIYPAIQELVKTGIFTSIGRIKFRGHNVPGPYIYRLNRLDPAKASVFMATTPRWKTGKKGDVGRFRQRSGVPVSETAKGIPGVPEIGTAKRRPGVPVSGVSGVPICEAPGVPICGPPGVPVIGTQKGSQREMERVPKGESEGGNAFPPSPLSISLSGGKDNDTGKEKQKKREALRTFMRIDTHRHKPLSWYVDHLRPRGYDPVDIASVWNEMDKGNDTDFCGS